MADHPSTGSVVAIVGASGGCGASTVACGIALAWAHSGGSPWLVELDAARADLAGRWDLPGERTVTDLEGVASELDRGHLDNAAAPHESGVAVLLGPARATADVSPLVVDRLVTALRREDPLVLDVAWAASLGSARAISAASAVLIVSPSTSAGARRASRAMDLVIGLGAGDRARLVAATFDGGGELSARGLSRAVGLDLACALPNAPRDAAALASGRWPGVRRRGLGRPLARLAEELT